MEAHGRIAKIYVKWANISPFLSSASLDRTKDAEDITTLSKDSKKYMPGQKDAVFSGDGIYNGDKDKIDKLAHEINTGKPIYSYYPFSDDAGSKGYAFKALQSASNISNSITGAASFSLGGQTSEGVHRVTSIIPLTEFDDNESSDGVDLGSAGADGAIVFIHVTGVTDKADIVIEHSDDDGVGDAYSAWTSLVDTDTVDGYIIDSDTAIKQWVRVTIANMIALETIEVQVGIKKH